MKKNYLKLAAFAIMMALTTACTNEVIVVQEGEPGNSLTLGPGEDVIEISLTNTSNTRAARPITSSEATNNINRIAFKFLDNNGTDLTAAEIAGIKIAEVIDEKGEKITNGGYTVDKENNVLKLENDFEPGDANVIHIKFAGLENGKGKSIRLIAYGYNVDEAAANSETDKFPYENITFGQKGEAGAKLLSCDASNATAIEEVFAGCDDETGETFVTINQHDRFTSIPEITLKRQVAALLVYFKEAPVFVDNKRVEKITVSTRYQGTGFYFPAALLGQENSIYNGKGNDPDNWVHYLTFDMKKADGYDSKKFKSGDTYTFSSGKNEGKKYLLAEEMNEIEELECVDNTLFGSCFLLPFEGYRDYYNTNSAGHATLNICYWTTTDEGTESLITRIPLTNGQPTGTGSDNTNNLYNYGIHCNNFYYIGTKKTAGNDGDDDDPTSIDEPTGWEHAAIGIENDFDKENGLFN